MKLVDVCELPGMCTMGGRGELNEGVAEGESFSRLFRHFSGQHPADGGRVRDESRNCPATGGQIEIDDLTRCPVKVQAPELQPNWPAKTGASSGLA